MATPRAAAVKRTANAAAVRMTTNLLQILTSPSHACLQMPRKGLPVLGRIVCRCQGKGLQVVDRLALRSNRGQKSKHVPSRLQKKGTTKAAAAMKTTADEQVKPAMATAAKKPAPVKKTPAAKKAATPKKTSAAEKAPARKKTTAVRKPAAQGKAAGKKPAAAQDGAPAGEAAGAGPKGPAKKAAATRKRGREAATEAEPRHLPAVEHPTHQKVSPPGRLLLSILTGSSRLGCWSSQQPAIPHWNPAHLKLHAR